MNEGHSEGLSKSVVIPAYHKSKSQAVDKHPLARSSSGSSDSSLEFDTTFSSNSSYGQDKTTSRVKVGRFRDFLTKLDDPAKAETSDPNAYPSASTLWHNRAKIFTNLKKQATDSVRSLTQSTSLDNGSNRGLLYKSLDDTLDVPSVPNEKAELSNPSSVSGLHKVKTESIVENTEDTEVDTFLQSFKERVSDPLQELKKREEEEAEKEEETLDMSTGNFSLRFRAHTTPANGSQLSKELYKPYNDGVSMPSKKNNDTPSKRSPFVVSLSSLMADKRQSIDDDLPDDGVSHDHDRNGGFKSSDDDDTFLDETLRKTSFQSVTSVCGRLQDDVTELHLTVPFTPVVLLSIVVYFYYIFPIPPFVQTIVTSFITGCVVTAAFLCLVAPRSRRLAPFLPTPVVNKVSPNTSKQLYDPELPIKGWVNELYAFEYDPDTYHISNTQSAYITLDGSTMRLQTPFKSIPRRSVYNEGNIPVTKVIQQRLFDITFAKLRFHLPVFHDVESEWPFVPLAGLFRQVDMGRKCLAKVYLKPPGLVKKRVWSKKYPICVEIPSEKPSEPAQHTKDDGQVMTDDDATLPPSKDVKHLYLFGRTDRQKEEWFYRIQRSINVALSKHRKAVKLAERKNSFTLPPSLNLEEDWGVIEDHYEEETFVASSAFDATKMNLEPIRSFQDYYVHVSRLMPDTKTSTTAGSQRNTSPSDSEKDLKTTDEHNTEVAWLNVVLGRIMFDFLRQPSWAKWLSVKIQKKLDKIKLPYFMDELKLTEMNLGSSTPLIHQISLPTLDSQGIWLEMEVTYSGTMQMTLKTKMVLTKLGKNEVTLLERESANRPSATTDSDAEDSAESSDDEESTVSRIVGQVQTAVFNKMEGQNTRPDPSNVTPATTPTSGAPPKKWVRIVDSITKSKYFQKATETEFIRQKLENFSNTPMLLTVELLELKGTLVVNIPPPPTDRIWYGFREPPIMLMKAHPKVGERVVKTTHVTDWIEKKLQQEFTKVLVVPNMDDLPVPVMYHNRPPSSRCYDGN